MEHITTQCGVTQQTTGLQYNTVWQDLIAESFFLSDKCLRLGPSSPRACLTAGCRCRWWTWWWAAIGGSCPSAAAGRSLVEPLQEPSARLTSRPSPVCTHLCPTDSGGLERKKNIETIQRFAVASTNGANTDHFCTPYRLLSLWINISEPLEEKGASEPEAQRNTQEHKGQCPTAPDDRGSHWKTRVGGSLFGDDLLNILD